MSNDPSAIPVNRRMETRHAPQTRAAAWFNIGMDTGELCRLKDISLTGFSIMCDEWQLPVFLACDHPLYCVLLIGEAHLGCMVRCTKLIDEHSSHVGFSFDAMPEGDSRLLQGLIGFLAGSDEDVEPEESAGA
jgi:hypothetical protein